MSHQTRKEIKLRYSVVRPRELDVSERLQLTKVISSIVGQAWADFSHSFIEHHILGSERIVIGYDKDEPIGFSAVGKKKLVGKLVHYIEFTAVLPNYQSLGIGQELTFLALKKAIISGLGGLIIRPIEIMLITPNIRVIATLARYASFVYPNPYLTDPNTNEIREADEQTWKMAQSLIASSDKPGRRLDRDGLVLHGSYSDAPWQILAGDKIPWHRNKAVNRFAEKYLGYGLGEDKEFVVRAQFSLLSLLKYFFSGTKASPAKRNAPESLENLSQHELKSITQFNNWAKHYDRGLWSIYFTKSCLAASSMLTAGEDYNVLDLGCGTGNLSIMLSDKPFIKQVVGLDISPEMNRIAETKREKLKISGEKLKFVLGKVDVLPFDAEKFDYVFCLNSFHHYFDQAVALKEINRVLRSNGHLILIDPFLDNPIRTGWGMILKFIFHERDAIYHKRETIQKLMKEGDFAIEEQRTFLYLTLVTKAVKVR